MILASTGDRRLNSDPEPHWEDGGNSADHRYAHPTPRSVYAPRRSYDPRRAHEVNPILDVARDEFDSGDPWGWVMAWWFAVADVLYTFAPEEVPEEWEFRQSPLGFAFNDDQARTILGVLGLTYWDDNTFTGRSTAWDLAVPRLRHAGAVFTKYAAQCRLNGKDY